MSILKSTNSGTHIQLTEDILIERGYSEFTYRIGYFQNKPVYNKQFVSSANPFISVNYDSFADEFWLVLNNKRITIKTCSELKELEYYCKNVNNIKNIKNEHTFFNTCWRKKCTF